MHSFVPLEMKKKLTYCLIGGATRICADEIIENELHFFSKHARADCVSRWKNKLRQEENKNNKKARICSVVFHMWYKGRNYPSKTVKCNQGIIFRCAIGNYVHIQIDCLQLKKRMPNSARSFRVFIHLLLLDYVYWPYDLASVQSRTWTPYLIECRSS